MRVFVAKKAKKRGGEKRHFPQYWRWNHFLDRFWSGWIDHFFWEWSGTNFFTDAYVKALTSPYYSLLILSKGGGRALFCPFTFESLSLWQSWQIDKLTITYGHSTKYQKDFNCGRYLSKFQFTHGNFIEVRHFAISKIDM